MPGFHKKIPVALGHDSQQAQPWVCLMEMLRLELVLSLGSCRSAPAPPSPISNASLQRLGCPTCCTELCPKQSSLLPATSLFVLSS